jgi:membrane protein
MTKFERIILQSRPVRFMSAKSKQIILPGFQQVPLYDVLKFFVTQVRRVGLNERAAAISFNFLMAIPAATIFLCTLIPYLPVSKQITRELLLLTRDITPNRNTYLLVRNFLEDFLNTPRSGLLSLGFVLAVFYASNAMMGIMRSFNKSFTVLSKRNVFEKRWLAIKLTTIVILLLLASIVVLVTQGALLKVILDWMDINSPLVKTLVKNLRWVIIIFLFFYSIAFIYKYAPAIHKRWKLYSPGTILATTLIILATFLFSFWVNRFGNYNKIYGSIGTIMILMVLVYVNSLVLLIGFELNVSIHALRQIAEERKKVENTLQ